MIEQETPIEETFYGYRFDITEATSDGRYHDRQRVRLEIRPPDSDDVLHIIERTSRSTHQLSRRYRPADSPRDAVISEAQHWVLANRADARAARAAEAAQVAERNRRRRREKFEAVGGDVADYVRSLSLELSATDVGRILGLGSARRLNRLLLDWHLQREDPHGGYGAIDPVHGEQAGFYAQLRWNGAGLKAIWDAAVHHDVTAGGDEEFARRVRANTEWLAFDQPPPPAPPAGVDGAGDGR